MSTTTLPVADQPRTSATLVQIAYALAYDIEHHVYDALTPDQRMELRRLPMQIDVLAERVRDLEDTVAAVRRVVTRGIDR